MLKRRLSWESKFEGHDGTISNATKARVSDGADRLAADRLKRRPSWAGKLEGVWVDLEDHKQSAHEIERSIQQQLSWRSETDVVDEIADLGLTKLDGVNVSTPLSIECAMHEAGADAAIKISLPPR